MIQEIINKAVALATQSALSGNPVSNITWIPPQTADQNPIGSFLIIYPNSFENSIQGTKIKC